ncbi:hypothetical protein B0H14DRAFT_2596274 [Mycena olivaceomarginata]|nr:hypothetical protein B0H14DRAFT_2596274 [Mycena olivaceomarginata]
MLPSVPVAALAPSGVFSGTPYTQGFPQGPNTSGVTGVGASGGTGFDTGLFGALYAQGLQQGTPYMQGLHDTLYAQGSTPSVQGNTYNVPGNPYSSAHTTSAVGVHKQRGHNYNYEEEGNKAGTPKDGCGGRGGDWQDMYINGVLAHVCAGILNIPRNMSSSTYDPIPCPYPISLTIYFL